VADHPVGGHPTYETLALLGWVAARTERIGIATKVLGVPFRRPAVVAKAAESLQRLSGGRLVLGLGGGYDDAEIAALGVPVPSPRVKVDGMADAIEIIHRIWSGPDVTFHGRVPAVENLTMTPRPAQHPCVPSTTPRSLWIAAARGPLMLSPARPPRSVRARWDDMLSACRLTGSPSRIDW
jgi:alkanesulfonate monooxygenase SsuD/methylene tetrahydromethanopterin reductase-like flavin-dependent oxidoreductase (luciferase family)